jgi:hypothetical protein
MADILSSLDQLRHTGAEFLIADLRTAIVFADMALQSAQPDVIRRNRDNALKAWRTVARYLSKSHLSEEDANAVSALFVRLKEKLASPGAAIE